MIDPRIVAIAMLAATLAACNHDKGSHTGQTLKDCAAIPASERGKAAKAIEDMTRPDAIRKIAEMFGVTEAAAADCLK